MSRKLALIIGNSEYQDPTLARLVTPNEDVNDLAEVLRDPTIGGFDEATTLINESAANIRLEIESLFADKKPDDLLLLYFSGHGVRDEQGQLYLAVKDTRHNRLRATAIPAVFITDGMDHTRSRRQVLILDCCHSGAFAQGAKGAPGASVGTAAAFEGTGFGRVVLTATDSTQYAWQGDEVIGESENSVFTYHLIEGLRTGAADRDADGRITLDELYDYVYEQVVTQTPKQTPGKSSYKQQGEIVIARNPHPIKPKPVELPVELRQLIESPIPSAREAATRELSHLLNGSLPELTLVAHEALKRLADDDSRRVANAAAQVLAAKAEAQRVKESMEAEARAQEEAARKKRAGEARARREAEEQARREAQARAEAERLAAQRAEEEGLAREKAEAERKARERAEAERQAKEEAERLAAQKAEEERLARERVEAGRVERERLAREKAEAERLVAQKTEAERIAAQTAEQARLAADRTEPGQKRLDSIAPQYVLPAPDSGAAQPVDLASRVTAFAQAMWLPLLITVIGLGSGWLIGISLADILYTFLSDNKLPGAEYVVGAAAWLVSAGLGGFGTALALRRARPSFRWRQALLFIGAWVVSAVIGWGLTETTPYSFSTSLAIFGAISGLGTGLILRSIEPAFQGKQIVVTTIGWAIAHYVGSLAQVSGAVNLAIQGGTIGLIGGGVMFWVLSEVRAAKQR